MRIAFTANSKRVVATLIAFFATGVIGVSLAAPMPAQPQTPSNSITDIAYAAQPDNSVYVAGQFQGKPVNMVRSGPVGAGKWTLYAGSLHDRVRFTFDDRKGLQDILAMDKGQRITLNPVGQERIEYRLYAPDRRFILGSVLYRKDGRWLQGIMRSEAFAGYAALTDVSDVTSQVGRQAANPAAGVLAWLKHRWHGIDLIPSAHALTADDLTRGFFSPSAQDTRGFFGKPLDDMWIGALVGAGAFTVKLAGQTMITGEAAAAGAALTAAAPFLVAVGAGVAIGVAAEKAYNWAEAKNLGGSSSVRDAYNRLVAGTRFSRDAPPRVPPALPINVSANVPLAPQASAPTAKAAPTNPSMTLLDMVDKLDKLDKQDLSDALEQADLCTSQRDFDCTTARIAKASKFAIDGDDRRALDASRQKMTQEKSRIAEEERQRAAEEQRLAELERQREQQRVAQAQRESSFQLGKAAAMLGGSLIGGIGKLSADAQVKIISGIVQDSSPGQTGISGFQSATTSITAAQQPRTVQARPTREQQAVPPPADAAGSARCLAQGEYGDKSSVPEKCWKGKNNTFGWGDTQAAACAAAQRSVIDEFDAGKNNPTGCYCAANAKVNSAVQPFVCWVMFD
ncbi:MAG: hypothetical protein IH605_19145 [Burkholderiales bacterium]|nr:hypothetical protein [Burkholderiales bacterium]